MRHFRHTLVALGGLSLVLLFSTAARAAGTFQVTDIVSDQMGMAEFTDSHLTNPWGLGFSATSPFWVGDQLTGVSTLYTASPTNPINPLVVSVPTTGGSGPPNTGPTGVVNNGSSSSFLVNGSAANFIFATLNGTIAAWNNVPTGNTTAATEFTATNGAIFTGLAIVNGSQNLLYAADNHNGVISVFNSLFQPTTVTGGFIDPNLPSGAVPFNIQAITVNGVTQLVVTYQGTSAVDIFDTNGNLLVHFPPTTPNALSQPWGVALAPATFGSFGGDLLIGNRGNGEINAFDPATGTLVGTLTGPNGQPIALPGLWGLAFRTGGGFDPNALYFAEGVGGGGNFFMHGLFGSITSVPEPSAALLFGLGLIAVCGLSTWNTRRRTRQAGPAAVAGDDSR